MDSDLYTDDQTYDISDVYFCNECFFARLLNCNLQNFSNLQRSIYYNKNVF
jgi:hypothetical protein